MMTNRRQLTVEQAEAEVAASAGCAPAAGSESSAVNVDPYQTEEYQQFMAQVAKTCDADDGPCDSCLAGAPCDGPPRLDPLWDSGLDDDELYDSWDGETPGKTTSDNALSSVASAAKRIEEPAETACSIECRPPHSNPQNGQTEARQ